MEHINTPEQEAIARENVARANAEWAAGVRAKQAHQRYIADTARDPSVVERQASEASRGLAEAKARARKVDAADLEARLAAAEAVAKAARTAFDIIDVRAQAARVKAMSAAGNDALARSMAAAKAQSDWAEAVGSAEKDLEEAHLEADRRAVDVARARKIAAHRIMAAETRLAEMAKGEQDPLRRSNPFADPIRPTITESQFDSIRDPELKARAAKEANIVPDNDPPFEKDEIEALLKARGSPAQVLTRADFAALSPADQARAAKSAIII